MKLPYIIKRPIITEQSMSRAVAGQYTFEVDLAATKGQVKKALESYFGVNVLEVRTQRTKGKTRRAGKLRKPVQKTDYKKAIIKVKPGQKIALFDAKEE